MQIFVFIHAVVGNTKCGHNLSCLELKALEAAPARDAAANAREGPTASPWLGLPLCCWYVLFSRKS